MKKCKKNLALLAAVLMMLAIVTVAACAAAPAVKAEGETTVEAVDAQTKGIKAIAAGVAIALVATGGAFAMSHAIAKSAESISKQPEASGNIRTSLMLGLVFIETAIIYALIVAILIVFVL